MGESCVSGKKELQAALSSPIEEQESGVGKKGLVAQRDPQAQTFSPERRRERAARSPSPVTAAEATTHSGSDLWSQPYPPLALKPLKPETPAHVSSNLAGFLSFPFFHYQLENLQFLRRRKKIKFKKKENKTTTKFGTSWDCALEPWVGQGHSGTPK